MKMEQVSFLEWQERYGNEAACIDALRRIRWPEGFQCPKCGHHAASLVSTRRLHQCSQCSHQVSATAGTLFHSTKLPRVKWFWAIYLIGADKGGISALRLAKFLGVSWLTAHRMLRKIRAAMGDRDRDYKLTDFIELDDAYVGGKHSGGKRGRGTEGNRAVLLAVERRGKGAGFMSAQVLDSISKKTVTRFVDECIHSGQTVRTDAYRSMNVIAKTQFHESRVTPGKEAGKWLLWVHIVIGNLKTFLNGTFHGVSGGYLQEYLDEFCYRFNRRFWERELPFRLLNACLIHKPLPITDFR